MRRIECICSPPRHSPNCPRHSATAPEPSHTKVTTAQELIEEVLTLSAARKELPPFDLTLQEQITLENTTLDLVRLAPKLARMLKVATLLLDRIDFNESADLFPSTVGEVRRTKIELDRIAGGE